MLFLFWMPFETWQTFYFELSSTGLQDRFIEFHFPVALSPFRLCILYP